MGLSMEYGPLPARYIYSPAPVVLDNEASVYVFSSWLFSDVSEIR